MASLSEISWEIGPPAVTGLCRQSVSERVRAYACTRTCRSPLPQIELLINRPTPTWQSLHFNKTVPTISQILLIWQNPKIKQSPPHLLLSRALESGPLLKQWVPDVWDVFPELANLPSLPPYALALDIAFLLASAWSWVCRSRSQSSQGS